MILPLQLRYDPALDAEPEAWFLPGDSVARWLNELLRCGLAEAETRLFLVPKSAEHRAAAGLLVVPTRAGSITRKPAGIACRLIAGRLFAPVDAVLHPPVAEGELRGLCPLPVSFFHPAFGLSGFETESTLRVWDLIELPEETTGNWNFARPGAPGLSELQAVTLARPPSIEDVFGGAQKEIGSEPLLDLPPAPDEPKDGALAKSGRTLRGSLAKGVSGLMRRIPHIGSRRTWVNSVEDWAERQLRGIGDQLQQLRNKELHRLLHLFDTNPESALRHAIPMNAFAHRGLAPPGARLGPRSANLDLGRLGGRAADLWDVPANFQELLRLRYREMADREMQLGRHRRAAYIYAELLGDLVSTANALKQGKYFREAALVYEEHLKNPLEAARCLEEGGLLTEAIERYEKLGRWLEAADLHERLGHRAAAEAAVRRVVNERVAQDDLLGAARLVEERLHNTDEALDLLLRAWPSSRQAAGCVGEAFQLLARLGRHAAALERLAQFAREPLPPSLALPLLTALGGPARDYPHDPVRHRAADFSRALIARQLGHPALTAEEAGRLMECLVRLAPQDRLLARDANRYLAGRREREHGARRLAPLPTVADKKPVVVRCFELPRQMEWLRLRTEWHWFYAVGVTPQRLTLVRGVWEGELQSLSWKCPREAAKNGLLFEPTGERGRAVVLATSSGPPFDAKAFPATDLFFATECVAATPGWLTSECWHMAFGEESVWTAHAASGRAILSCLDKRGTLQRTADVTEALLTRAERSPQTRLCLAVIGDRAAIALGNRLVLLSGHSGLLRIELPGQAVDLLATLPHTRPGLAILLEHGAAMYWLGAPGLLELDRDIASPRGAFVPGGPLVLASKSQLLLLEVDSGGVQKYTRAELTSQRTVGVGATASPGQFALLSASGEMTVYRVPR